MLKVLSIKDDHIYFEQGFELYSNHESECCEMHYLGMHDMSVSDFEGLEFNIMDDSFFERIEDYGIALISTTGVKVRIPGYGSNSGFYSANLDLVVTDNKKYTKKYEINECQAIRWVD